MTKLVAAAQYIDGVLGRRTNSRVGSALSAKAAKEASKQRAATAASQPATTSG
jgi:hypothetical protein